MPELSKEAKDKVNRERMGCAQCYHHKGLHDEKMGCVRGCSCKLIYP